MKLPIEMMSGRIWIQIMLKGSKNWHPLVAVNRQTTFKWSTMDQVEEFVFFRPVTKGQNYSSICPLVPNYFYYHF